MNRIFQRLANFVALALFSVSCLIISLVSGNAESAGAGFGKPASLQDVAAWNLTVYPDGKGLPPGQGTMAEGKVIYEQRCQSCHGANGAGGSGDELAGAKHALTDANPDKTLGSFWPYATTLFDYLRRAMPPDAPGSLNDNQTYAVSAYLLYLNGIVGENALMNPETLPKVNMPNREGFIRVDAPK